MDRAGDGEGPLPLTADLAPVVRLADKCPSARKHGASVAPRCQDIGWRECRFRARLGTGRVFAILAGATVRYASRSLTGMAEVVLRVRLISGDRLDVTYVETGTADGDEVAEHVIAALAVDSGMIRARHGDRVVVVYGRGVAALELAPRGAVL